MLYFIYKYMNKAYKNIKQTLSRYIYFRVGVVFSIILFNILISLYIRKSGLYFNENLFPFGLRINVGIIGALLVFVTWGLYQYRLFYRYVIYTILIMCGSWSNLIERFVFGSVTDYINFGIVYANIADLQIWIGVLMLNYFAWTDRENLDSTLWKDLV
jgi:lipoprotein signal peptidase